MEVFHFPVSRKVEKEEENSQSVRLIRRKGGEFPRRAPLISGGGLRWVRGRRGGKATSPYEWMR
jgi:hypothetical protein